MPIDDDQLRELFREEASEHLQTLEQGLLRLEANPDDAELLREVFRAAHSLKGAARVVQASSAHAVMHRFEDVLGQASRGSLTLTSHTIERFYQAIDAVRAFCEETVTGQAASFDVDAVIRQLEEDRSAVEAEQAQPTPEAQVSQEPPPASSDDAASPIELSIPEVSACRIDDETLRDLFKSETGEHIECLERGLMHLEQHPQDAERLEEVFRAAHSLKGAARVVSVGKVETLAHLFEETLSRARKGGQQLTTAAIDRLYSAVDSLREFCDEAITGHPVITDLDSVIARVSGADNRSPPAANSGEQELTKRADPGPAAAPPTTEIAPTAPAATGLAARPTPTFNIETIRVASTKLDSLMSQVGELSVTRGRIAHRVVEVEQLLAIWEQWNRDSHGVRSLANNPADEMTTRDIEQLFDYVRGDQERMDQFGRLLKALEAAVQGDDARIDLLASQLEDGIRSVRMLPLSTVFNFFPRMVRDLGRAEGKQVELDVLGGQTTADKRILEELKDPLTHMLRNAIDHGIETPAQRQANGKPAAATLRLSAAQRGANIVIEITDDGAGINIDAVRETALRRRIASEAELAKMSTPQMQHLIFAPGFSTQQIVTDLSGRGVGMDVVRANIERLRGTIEVDSEPGKGTTFRLVLPITVATRRVLLVAVDEAKFALPVEHVQTNLLVSQEEIFSLQGRGTILLGGEPVPVAKLRDVLELPPTNRSGRPEARSAAPRLECVILRVENYRFGFLVDELLEEQEVVVKPHGAILRHVRNVAGSTILQSGEVCITLNPLELMRSVLASPMIGKLEPAIDGEKRKKVILLAEDSIVTRTQEKRILETAGFEVVTAVDGEDAFNKLMSDEFDGVVSDVEMPNLNGLDLTEKIRGQVQHRDLPVILVTSLSTDEDRQRGMEVGADAYLTKPGFDQTQFIETVKRLV